MELHIYNEILTLFGEACSYCYNAEVDDILQAITN